ncbi:hypothetical protein [Hydrogenophaga sp. SL48]|uniref:hypothetical protein n=1 Tax=Hydrogenophaga sp. SL48 TaxID=2806347 RepID=UPI001F358735|nr:hypothetical protein [Hydrogenophaga sp. SL48]UJW80251.1 hypothetical protein IM738_20710 [Hydrogenophaga sp. SL48]
MGFANPLSIDPRLSAGFGWRVSCPGSLRAPAGPRLQAVMVFSLVGDGGAG